MQQLPSVVKKYCLRNGIRYEWEGEDIIEFTSPEGKVFGNASRRRYLDISDMSALEIVETLVLFLARRKDE